MSSICISTILRLGDYVSIYSLKITLYQLAGFCFDGAFQMSLNDIEYIHTLRAISSISQLCAFS